MPSTGSGATEEARTIAEHLSDPQSRRTMLRIAED